MNKIIPIIVSATAGMVLGFAFALSPSAIGQPTPVIPGPSRITPALIMCPGGEVPVGVDGGTSQCAYPSTMKGGPILLDSLDAGGITLWNGTGIPVLSPGIGVVNAASSSGGVSIADESGNGIDQNTDGGWTVEAESANLTTSGEDGGTLQIRAEGAPNANLCLESGAVCTTRAGQNIDMTAATGVHITSGSGGTVETSTGEYVLTSNGVLINDPYGSGVAVESNGNVSVFSDGGTIVVETTGNTTVYTDGGNIVLTDLATGDYAEVSGSSGITLSDTAGKNIIETTSATMQLTASGGASVINLLSAGDAGASITAQHGPFTVAAAGECSFACSSYSWPVQVQIDFSAYNAANLGSATAFSRTVFANASTLTSASNIAIDSAGVGTGPIVVKLCSDGVTCGAGNVYLTCTPTGTDCTAAAGTITACTVTKSAVSAATTLTWSVQTACGTTDPGFNVVAHATTP